VATSIPYVREIEVEAGRVDELSPLIRRVVAPNPNRFTYTGTGTYLIGRGEVAVIDPGPAIESHVDAIMRALDDGERVTHLVITHTHSDHSPAAALMKPLTGAVTVGYGPHGAVAEDDPDDRVVFGDEEADNVTFGEENRDGVHPEAVRETSDVSFVPDVAVRSGDVVAGPGWTLQAVHTPGHTSNHVCYCLLEEDTLFTGDHVMGWSTSVIAPPDGNLGDYMRSLELLMQRAERRYWPTHGPAIDEPRQLVGAYLAHRRERSYQILSGLAEGPATIGGLVPRVYADVSKQLWKPAAASMYAHVLQLLEDGRIEIADASSTPRMTTLYRLSK
jgi:glyoxylase-like metal-dependent hydrolase (beta-lactamase superfamily II)